MAGQQDDQEYDVGMSDYATPDPAAVQYADEQAQTQKLAALPRNTDSFTRGLMQGNLFATMAVGDPASTQAKQTKDAVTTALSQAQSQAVDGENPLDMQQRLATNILKNSASVNPGLAQQAAQKLVQIQNARDEQSKIQSSTAINKIKIADASMQTYTLVGKDAQGAPMAIGSPVSVTDADGNINSKALADLQQQRVAYMQSHPGEDIQIGTSDSVTNGKAAIQAKKSAASLQKSQEDAQARLVLLQQKLAEKGQKLSGQQMMQVQRVFGSANLASDTLTQMMQLNYGASTGIGGWGAHPGQGLMDTISGNLRNRMSFQENQDYRALSAGLFRNIAAIETVGQAGGVAALAKQMQDSEAIIPGDSIGTAMLKMANSRRIVERGIDTFMARKDIPQDLKDSVQDRLEEMRTAIPFTTQDVINYQRAGQKNPQLTFSQFAEQNKLGAPSGVQTPPMGASTLNKPGANPANGQERARADDAIRRGANADAVAARFKKATGEDY